MGGLAAGKCQHVWRVIQYIFLQAASATARSYRSSRASWSGPASRALPRPAPQPCGLLCRAKNEIRRRPPARPSHARLARIASRNSSVYDESEKQNRSLSPYPHGAERRVTCWGMVGFVTYLSVAVEYVIYILYGTGHDHDIDWNRVEPWRLRTERDNLG